MDIGGIDIYKLVPPIVLWEVGQMDRIKISEAFLVTESEKILYNIWLELKEMNEGKKEDKVKPQAKPAAKKKDETK